MLNNFVPLYQIQYKPLKLSTMKNFIKKANKKAWKEIQQIKDSKNMFMVESAINTALLKTFGIKDFGLMKIAMTKGDDYSQLRIEYGCNTYNSNYDLLKTIRNHNFDTYHKEVKKYLISFIPERMKIVRMYKELIQTTN